MPTPKFSYFDRLSGRETVEFFVVVIATGFVLGGLPPDQSLPETATYVACFGWQSWLMIRVNRRHQLIGSVSLRRLLADALMIALTHFVLAGSGLFHQPWMIYGLLVTPILHVVVGAAWLRRRPEAREAPDDTLAVLRDNLAELRRMRTRFGCYLRLHAWTPHQAVDHLCICDRCTEIARHRWREGRCARCGAAKPIEATATAPVIED